MSQNLWYSVAILILSICLSSFLNAQSENEKGFTRKTIGIGIQSAFPAFGASG